jgi:hypothetical protein
MRRESTTRAVRRLARDGRYDRSLFWAAVLVQKGMYVEFDLISPRDPEPTADQKDFLHSELEDFLHSVAWAPDPGNDATWPAVTDWAK